MTARRVLLVATVCALTLPPPGAAKEYLLTATKPNNLVLVDPAARSVARVYPVPGPGIYWTVAPSPDGKVAYIVTNRWESISGIDLDTGKEVFRADLSSTGLQVKCMWGLVVSPDSKDLYVYELPVKQEPDRLEVQDTRIAVFRTDAGIRAKHVRTFPAPRRISQLAMSTDGTRLYAAGWDVYAIDPLSGQIVTTHKVRNWDRPGFTPPDSIAAFPDYEQPNVMSVLYAAQRTDRPPTDPGAFAVGFWLLDLATGKFRMQDIEQPPELLFSAVINPVRRNELYTVSKALKRIDIEQGKVLTEVDVDHDYWMVNVSGDGKEVYVGGNMDDISIYASDTLERLGTIKMPGGADQVQGSLRVIRR